MDLEQQQQAALTQLSEAGTQLMNAEGEAVDGIIAQIETLMDPVDTLTADLQATRDKLQEDRALYGEAQSALDNELGSALDHIRANSYEKAYEEITALQEEGGKLTDEREAPAEVEAAGTAEENVSEETGDLQETEEENGSIINMVNGEKMFENDSPSQGIYDPERDVIRYPDEDVPHSLGARSWNDMDILVPWSNSTAKLAPGTRLQNVETFAGKGTRVKIRDTQRLEETYNIPADKWEKTKGFGTVIFEGEEYEAEIHWYQYKDEYGINREEAKVKSMDTEEIW